MKSKVKISLLLIMSFVFFSLPNVAISTEQSQHKIVIFKEGVKDSITSEIIAKVGGSIKKPLPLIHGKAIVLPTKAAEKALKQYPEVLRIDEDIQITITKAPATSVQPAQSLPWGVDRIDAELAWVSSTGQAVKVAIIDTGVDRNHPDVLANIKGGINTINSAKTFQDDNGHGTHVAGIIGAVNNSIGVVGTAPQVEIYSVKVLGRTGSGYLSDIIEGL
ncbi:MAG: S8 family serine peptidase, partial [Carboxydocellales bacterium]